MQEGETETEMMDSQKRNKIWNSYLKLVDFIFPFWRITKNVKHKIINKANRRLNPKHILFALSEIVQPTSTTFTILLLKNKN